MESFLLDICGESYLETNSKRPDFNKCIQQTLFRWVPCVVLWILTPSWIHMVNRKRLTYTKFSWLTFTKMTILFLLIINEATKIILSIVGELDKNKVNFITPSILIVSYFVVLVIIWTELRHGLRSSMLLFSYWGFMILLSTFEFRTNIYMIIEKDQNDQKLTYWESILFFENYGLMLLMFFFTLFSESKVDKEALKNPKLYPEHKSSLLFRLTFWWLNPLILNGYKKELTHDDMWDIDATERSCYLTDKLEVEWNKAARKYMEAKKLQYDNEAFSGSEEKMEYKEEPIVKRKLKEPSLLWCLIKIFNGKFIAGSFLKLIQDGLTMVGPTILNLIIKFVENKDLDVQLGYFYMGLLFFSSVLQTILLQHYFHRMFIVGARVRSSLMGLIYRKSLRLSSQSRRLATVGEMTNLMQVNTQSFVDLTAYINILWSGPLQIAICIFLLWQYLGVACLAGVGVMVISIPLNGFLSNRAKVYQTKKLKEQDSRIKMTNEVLSGIKVLKLYGWELSFRNLIDKIREKELDIFYRNGIYNVFIKFSFEISSFVVALASFIVYIVTGNNLNASTAFVSLTLFNTMRFPLIMFPNVITMLIQANVSMTRIRTFLLRDELDTNQIKHDNVAGEAVKFRNVDLGWSETEKTLHNLNFEVKKGELVAVVGSVGSGKSSLISGLLGEMHKFKGYINVNGSTAYVSQQAWIQNSTLRNNILFGNDYDRDLYEKILSSCALVSDLEILPAGDQTEIGEKGINLSGGQKQRISLARSVYAKASIYTFDDPLSAVDAHVGKHIFDSVIGPKGLLKHKTRIFATNSLSFLSECDKIIMLDKGSIKEIGTYIELIEKNSAFSKFMGEYILKQKVDQDEENLSIETKNNQKYFGRKIQDDVNVGEKIIVKEKVETGQVKLKILLEYFKSCTMWLSIIFIILLIFYNIFQAGSSLWLSDWSDKADDPQYENSTWNDKYVRLGVYGSIGLVQSIIMLVSEFIFLKMVMRSSRFLHSSMLYSILRSNMQFFESTPIGRIINRFSKDIEAVENMIPMSYRNLVRCIFQVLVTIIMISFVTPFFLIPLVPISIVYYFVQRFYVAAMRQLRRLNSVSKSPIFSHFGETLTGVSTIRAYSSERRFIKQMENKIDNNLSFFYPDTISNRWLAVRLEFIGTLVTFFSCLFVVLSRDTLSAGNAGLSISFSLNVSQFLNWLVRMSADFESNITSVERIKEYCETPHEAAWIKENSRPPLEWPAQGHISFDHFSVKYREELDFVLKDINCVISPGEKIGIVGRTGAGKSSLTLALFRILESNYGKIKIDNIDIKKIGLHDLRKKLTIIPQDPVLFSGSLRINLDPFEEYSDDQIWVALDDAHLKSFVQGLDKKLDFECSEGGENLSVGQRQLICLARALLRKTKILVLDEATASIDHNTDDLIQATIRSQFKDCTVLTIAHRLNTIMDSTRIMVLDKGKIVEFDSPENLLFNEDSLFFSMAYSVGLAKIDDSQKRF
ncbi:multidrug resistance-associated 1 [Brachionus plicatilis]|uniref:ABC-type glutathione-S-conjugate transporter n=1 Tax=Brachionus plicatilis TaxID=10195 RepID=A0A3M7T4F6_BRAPC|nr:multidrug resistance-associated 1 [Brachionus plicatilis]